MHKMHNMELCDGKLTTWSLLM